jgi:hypothetical protein
VRTWLVQQPQREAELEALRASVMRGGPFDSPGWIEEIANRMRFRASLRDPGRRRKQPDPDEATLFQG